MTVLGKCGWKLHQNNIQVLLQLENSRTKIISLFIEAVVHGGRERREGCETEGFGKKSFTKNNNRQKRNGFSLERKNENEENAK